MINHKHRYQLGDIVQVTNPLLVRKGMRGVKGMVISLHAKHQRLYSADYCIALMSRKDSQNSKKYKKIQVDEYEIRKIGSIEDYIEPEEEKAPMIKALKGHVIVKNIDDGIKSDTIIIPGSIKEKNMIGRITDTAIKDLKVGDVILFGRYGGKELEHEGEGLRSINGEDIFAITDPELENISPVSDWLLVELQESPDKIGSIYVPKEEKAPDSFNKAKVIVAGPGRTFKNGETCKMTVKKGDGILFGPYCSYAVKVKGRNLTMVRETSCEAIMGVE